MVVFDRHEQAEVSCRRSEHVGMLPGFPCLFIELPGAPVAVDAGLRSEFGIHRGVFVGFALNGKFEASAQNCQLLEFAEFLRVLDHQLRVEHAEMGKRVFGFLCRRVFKQSGQIPVAELLGHISEKEVFATGHAFSAEGGIEIALCSRAGEGGLCGGQLRLLRDQAWNFIISLSETNHSFIGCNVDK